MSRETNTGASTRPTLAEIDLDAMAHNLRMVKQRVAPAKVMAVVKANAYGHGLLNVTDRAVREGADYLGVALVEEGIRLRNRQKDIPILVFGGFFPEQIDAFLAHDLELTLYDQPCAEALAERARNLGCDARVHIKVDTGMGRVGVPWQQASDFVRRVAELPGVALVGIYTHFATSDERDKGFAELQLKRFSEVLEQLEARSIHIPLKHAANSGAVLDMPVSYFDMVRLGVSLYGYYPSPATSREMPLRPAMSLKSRVIFLKEVAAGTPVSYGCTYVTSAPTRIATVPIGYADGYNRRLSNAAEVLIRGRRYPVVGRVCMDQIMVDVGRDTAVEVGDEVVLMGRQGDDAISIYEWCEVLQTIPYEVTCWMSERVPRVYKPA